MSGGTTFHFVTDGIHAALARAVDAANGQDIRLGGGVATIRQYLCAGLIDEMHLAISPILLGSGECLLQGIDAPNLGYQRAEHVPTSTHVVITARVGNAHGVQDHGGTDSPVPFIDTLGAKHYLPDAGWLRLANKACSSNVADEGGC